MNSEIAFEDLGSFMSRVVVKGRRFVHQVKFTDRETGLRGYGSTRTTAFYACIAEVARYRFKQWMNRPKQPPAVDMGVVRGANVQSSAQEIR